MQYQPPLMPKPEPHIGQHMTPEAFTQSVCAMASSMIAANALPADFEGLHVIRPLEVKLGLFHLDLEPFYRTARENPDGIEQLLRKDLATLTDPTTHAILRAPLDLVCERVMPRLRNFQDIQHHCLRRQFFYRPVANDAVLHFVVDTGESMVVIDADQAKRWGVSFDALEDRSMANLRDLTARHDGGTMDLIGPHFSFEESEGYSPEFIMGNIAYDDCYDASRLLLPGLHAALAPTFGQTFYAVIPTASTLAFFPLHITPPALAMINGRSQLLFDTDSTRISTHLFQVTADGVAGTTAYLSEEWHDRL